MATPIENIGRQPTVEELGVVSIRIGAAYSLLRLRYVDACQNEIGEDHSDLERGVLRLGAVKAGVEISIHSGPVTLEMPRSQTMIFKIGERTEKIQPTTYELGFLHGRLESLKEQHVDEGDIFDAFRAGVQMGIDGRVATLAIPGSETMIFRIEQASSVVGSPSASISPSELLSKGDIHG